MITAIYEDSAERADRQFQQAIGEFDNPFVYAAFVSQMKRWCNAQVKSGTGIDASIDAANASASPASKPNVPPQSQRSLGDRVAGFVGRQKES